jgi:hypothetical protein
MALHYRPAGVAEMRLMHLQAGCDLELVVELVAAESMRVAPAGTLFGRTMRHLALRQRRVRYRNCNESK